MAGPRELRLPRARSTSSNELGPRADRALLRGGAATARRPFSSPRRSPAPTVATGALGGARRAGASTSRSSAPRRGGRAALRRADRRRALDARGAARAARAPRRAQVAQRSLRRPAQARRASSRSRARRARTRTSRSASASTCSGRAASSRRRRTRRPSRRRRAGRSRCAPLLQALLDRFDRELAAPRWDDEVARVGARRAAPAGRPAHRSAATARRSRAPTWGSTRRGSCASRPRAGETTVAVRRGGRSGERAGAPARRCSPSTSATRTPCSGSGAGASSLRHWRLTTRRDATADEIALSVRGLLRGRGAAAGDGARRASSSRASCRRSSSRCARRSGRSSGAEPLFVEPGIKTGMPILYEVPQEVGADRIVNAVAALDAARRARASSSTSARRRPSTS